MFEVVPLKREHLSELYGRETEDDTLQNDLRTRFGRAYTALLDGRVIGAGGIVRVWEGSGIAWTVLSEEIKAGHKKSLHKTVKKKFPAIVAELKLERVQADTLADSTGNCAWLERLGFGFEGLMRRYRDGKDYNRYAWVR